MLNRFVEFFLRQTVRMNSKFLVADKITAWNEYLERHKTLLSIEFR
jgi:hypothetical protein